MTIKGPEEFTLLLNTSELGGIPIFKVFLGLMHGLNRGCKCNKEKRLKQLSLSYKTVLLKKKDDEFFQEKLKQFLIDNEEESIIFKHEEEEIFSLSL